VTGLDTNVIVRFLVQDDPEQGRLAKAAFDQCTEDSPGFICREVAVELVWVLERSYKFDREAIAGALDGLLGAAEIVFEDSERVARAVHRYREENFGFADLMIVSAARASGCSELVTFDKKAAQIPGVIQLV